MPSCLCHPRPSSLLTFPDVSNPKDFMPKQKSICISFVLFYITDHTIIVTLLLSRFFEIVLDPYIETSLFFSMAVYYSTLCIIIDESSLLLMGIRLFLVHLQTTLQ